ncbi:hypothetical protein L226DRAFT_241538 [Lentinus tigrinus ALCF2SS1-7]|uniref:uncharacterized protein n=1 Tax=Lentinus tigrinus ALCF2SS1-7 TaxID=1328758 RepID=UPI001165E94D|nr:hypothetical protein L226DRAFT_241538 [Lentinus tigrinus ALCF2SS1-7]
MRRLFRSQLAGKKQRGRPRTRKQSLTEPKHEKEDESESESASLCILSPPGVSSHARGLRRDGARGRSRTRPASDVRVLSDSSRLFQTASAPYVLLANTLATR